VQGKVRHPQGCSVPTGQAYVFESEFNQAFVSTPDVAEATVFAQVGGRHGVSASTVERGVLSVEGWMNC
jgi:hypothetical protein